MLPRPQGCRGCAIDTPYQHRNKTYPAATGFSQPTGPSNAKILTILEALGKEEAASGKPAVGPAGQKFDSLLRRAGLDREEVRVFNTIQCQPYNNWLSDSPWEQEAINHCAVHRDKVLSEEHEVVVAAGAIATRTLMNQPKHKFDLKSWHGTINRDPQDRFWVVPTFHPSFILQGKHNLTGTCIFDLGVAKELVEHGRTLDPAQLVVDPPIDWFTKWVDTHCESAEGLWLAVDIETPEKITGADEGELEGTGNIIRINFANDPNLGITVPWEGRYIEQAQRLFNSGSALIFWNERYDVPILRGDLTARGDAFSPVGPVFDFMWGWHVLQSDLPRGLGFVSPFYSSWGAWKHLSGANPGRYAAIDAIQTLRCAFGIAKDLKEGGQWDAFYRHIYLLDTYVLRPAEEVGLLVDREELQAFKEDKQAEEDRLVAAIRAIAPPEACKLEEKLYKRAPKDLEGLEEIKITDETQKCFTCGAVDISKKHRCKDKSLEPEVKSCYAEVTRWRKTERREFLPSSNDDVARYMELKGIKPKVSKKRKSDKTPVDDKALDAAYKKTKDPFFKMMREFRSIAKVVGTYAEGTENRLGKDGRLHSKFGHHPSTLRLSSRDPNLQNIVGDKEGDEAPAAGFRRCLVAGSGYALVEADFGGIEAVLTGWFARDPSYIRLARLGVHAYLTSHLVGQPADLSWDDDKLGAYLSQIKQNNKIQYVPMKKAVHRTNFGSTPWGMYNDDPDVFGSRANATKYQKLYMDVCPALPSWWGDLRKLAARQGYLGGSDHPFGYRHWFWNVFNKRGESWSLGEDGKACIAFFPQSTAAGILAETALALVDPASENYIGDMYDGERTPVRALVHDSILSEVREDCIDEYVKRVRRQMESPIKQLPVPAEWGMGEYLSIGCSISVGPSWKDMTAV